jgi:hypothetical protein
MPHPNPLHQSVEREKIVLSLTPPCGGRLALEGGVNNFVSRELPPVIYSTIFRD